MNFIYGLAIGILAGAIGGALVWRKNGAKLAAIAAAAENLKTTIQ